MSDQQGDTTYDSRPDTYEHIGHVQDLLLSLASELMLRARVHDESKLHEPELSVFNEFTPRLAQLTYGTDEYKANLEAMGPVLKHHYAANRHHPEHFPNGIRGMNLIDLIEMVCDWKAATLRNKDGDIHRSIDMNRERFGYDDLLADLMHNTVTHLLG